MPLALASTIPLDAVPDMIDEFPALFVAAACARGTTHVRGAARIARQGIRPHRHDGRGPAFARRAGRGNQRRRRDPRRAAASAAALVSHGDHRVAMAFAVAGQRAEDEVRIADIANVATSFPGFEALARSAGMGLRAAG
jgi:3-phosphoshikimate 1-carboxyvinyltransferase